MTFPLLLPIPLILNYSSELLRSIAFGYITGMVIQDLSRFLSKLGRGLKRWNPENVDWFAWTRVGRFAIPTPYLFAFAIATVIALI